MYSLYEFFWKTLILAFEALNSAAYAQNCIFFRILDPLYRVYISKAFFLLLADCFEMYARESKILTKSKHRIEYISGDGSGAHKIGYSGTPQTQIHGWNATRKIVFFIFCYCFKKILGEMFMIGSKTQGNLGIYPTHHYI